MIEKANPENSKPLVSVIIAVKNGERFIKTAIESVLSQTYLPLEILAIDGGSTDKTLEIIGEFEQIKIIEQTGRGIGNAYNTGISNAQGEFISFLSSDDYWMKEKIERQISVLQNNASVSFVVSLADFFLQDASRIPAGFRTGLIEKPQVAFIMETLFAHRSVFETVGLFNEKMETAEDVDWFARAKDLRLKSFVVEEILIRKRIHDKNIHLNAVQNTHDLLSAVKNSFVRKRGLPKI